MPDVTALLIVHNEEVNLPQAIASVQGWVKDIVVVDAYSTDRTVEIALNTGCTVIQHAFEGFAAQRNFALQLPEIRTEWILVLDADEWISPELKDEITRVLQSSPTANGFYLQRRLVWMGRSIRFGTLSPWILRLVRKGTAHCEERTVNEHLIVTGSAAYMHNKFVHEDHHDLTHWVNKHNQYSSFEANEIYRGRSGDQVRGRLFGSAVERRRWLRTTVYGRAPRGTRSILFFLYRYILLGGFLDGSPGFSFHFLQALWFPLLIDLKLSELEKGSGPRGSRPNGFPAGQYSH